MKKSDLDRDKSMMNTNSIISSCEPLIISRLTDESYYIYSEEYIYIIIVDCTYIHLINQYENDVL